jgi:hypothetical protein
MFLGEKIKDSKHRKGVSDKESTGEAGASLLLQDIGAKYRTLREIVKIVCLYCGYCEADEKKMDSSKAAVYSIGAEVC